MIETLRHSEAFEYYYSMGQKRSLRGVGVKFKVSEQSAHKWNKAFNWQERVQLRDQEISQRVEKKTNTSFVNEKAKLLNILKAQINEILKKDTNGKALISVKITDQSDLLKTIDSMLKLMGEDPESKIRRYIIGFNGDGRNPGSSD